MGWMARHYNRLNPHHIPVNVTKLRQCEHLLKRGLGSITGVSFIRFVVDEVALKGLL
jgi:hypothetical protein